MDKNTNLRTSRGRRRLLSALAAAMSQADPADRIVVFGSFYTVGGVLKDGLPRGVARHVG